MRTPIAALVMFILGAPALHASEINLTCITQNVFISHVIESGIEGEEPQPYGHLREQSYDPDGATLNHISLNSPAEGGTISSTCTPYMWRIELTSQTIADSWFASYYVLRGNVETVSLVKTIIKDAERTD